MIAELCWYWDAYAAPWSHVIIAGALVLIVIWYGYFYMEAPRRWENSGVYWTHEGWWVLCPGGLFDSTRGPYLTKELARAAIDKHYKKEKADAKV